VRSNPISKGAEDLLIPTLTVVYHMDSRILEIRKHLKKKLDPMRFEHTLGVAYTCQALAMRYEYDLDKAELAGLLHDCAKRFDGETLRVKCLSRNIPITEGEDRDPALLHAKLGAWMAREKYGIDDEEILSAIACHNTGKPGMSLLDKILYVADYIEPRRDKAANLLAMRKLAFEDLDQACLSIMESTLSYLKSKNCPIDIMTVIACEDMRQVMKEKKTIIIEKKEEQTFESGKRNGKTRSRSVGREKGRRYKNHRY